VADDACRRGTRTGTAALAEVQRLWDLASALPPAQRASFDQSIRAAAERYVAVTQQDRREARIARAPTSIDDSP
jgi:hypothetical protein